MRVLLIFILAGLVSACATAVGTPYAPANAQGYGYEDSRIEDDRFRVIFRGDGATPLELVEDYALRRAAEIAANNGYEWFRIVRKDINGEEKGGVGVGAGVGTGSFGRRGGVSVGLGGDLGTIGAREFFTVRLEILCGSGEKPSDSEIYDAQSVLSTVRELSLQAQ